MSATTKKKPARLTPNMKWVLEGICEGKPAQHGCYGRSEFGARTGTLIALQVRGLLDQDNLPTESAKAMFPMQNLSNLVPKGVSAD